MGSKQKQRHSTLTQEESAELASFRATSAEAASNQAGQLDKAILTIASLTFGGSIAYISWLERVNAPLPMDWAIATWSLMPTAIASVIATFYLSKVAGVRYVRLVDQLVASPTLYTSSAFSANWAAGASRVAHVLGCLVFLGGLAAFAGLLIVGLRGVPSP